jgi:sorbitol/mannitol transport system permease protein
MTTTVEKDTETTAPAAASKKKSRKFSPWGVVPGSSARLLLPGVLDGADGLQAGGRRGDQSADAVLHPDAGSVQGGVRAGHRPGDAELAFATGMSTILVLLLGVPAAFALSLRPVRKTRTRCSSS